jgi:hypothetical protein
LLPLTIDDVEDDDDDEDEDDDDDDEEVFKPSIGL